MAFPAAAAALTLAGTAMQISGQIQQANTQAGIARFNAQQAAQQAESSAQFAQRDAVVADQQLRTEREATELETRLLRERERFRRGQETVDVAAAGFEMTGSPLAVATRRAREAELEIELNQLASRQRQAQIEDTRAMATFRAAEFRRRGAEALRLGRFRSEAFRQTGTAQAIATGIGGAVQTARPLLRARQ